MRIRKLYPILVLVVTGASIGVGRQPASDLGANLLADPAVKAAVESARQSEPQTIADQIALCEIPAPPFKEQKRAEAYAKLFREAGLRNVRIDREGNVLGDRPGLSPRPHLVFTAHLDTVFPEGTDVTVRREGTILAGPGIGDDCRGLAVVLSVARALNRAGVSTPGSITFVGTVGEEGLGDLRGVKHLVQQELRGRIDRFVSIDGTGLGVTHIAVGSHRYRVTVKGPGGHSYGSFGVANPVHALGRAMARIAEFQVPRDPRTTFSVGRIGGGTSVNAIPAEAWMEIDMRSSDPAALQGLDASFHAAVDEAVLEENQRWGRGRLTVVKDLVGDRPAGSTPADSWIVQTAVAVTRALSLPVTLDEGSTDANLPMQMKIPAITIDGGGGGAGAHSLSETFDITDSWKGTERATLLAIALARPE